MPDGRFFWNHQPSPGTSQNQVPHRISFGWRLPTRKSFITPNAKARPVHNGFCTDYPNAKLNAYQAQAIHEVQTHSPELMSGQAVRCRTRRNLLLALSSQSNSGERLRVHRRLYTGRQRRQMGRTYFRKELPSSTVLLFKRKHSAPGNRFRERGIRNLNRPHLHRVHDFRADGNRAMITTVAPGCNGPRRQDFQRGFNRVLRIDEIERHDDP